jgi:hypothetical protein
MALAMAGSAVLMFSTIWDGFCNIVPTLTELPKHSEWFEKFSEECIRASAPILVHVSG